MTTFWHGDFTADTPYGATLTPVSQFVSETDGYDDQSEGMTEKPYWEFWQFKAHIILLQYMSGIIMIVGALGNMLTLVVLQGPHYKSSPTSTVVISALAVADLGYLLIGLTRQWIIGLTDFSLDVRNLNLATCRLQTGFTYFFKHTSACLLAFLTLERTACVFYPLRFKQGITRKRMLTFLSILTFLLLSLNLLSTLHLGLVRTRRIPCDDKTEWDTWYTIYVWYWIDAFLSNLIPFPIIAIGNVSIIVKLAMERTKRATQMQVQTDKKTNSTTTMLIAAGVAFLLTSTPKAIYYFGIGYNWWQYDTNEGIAKLYLGYIITTLLVYLNSALNFFLYCVTGTKFRHAFFDTVRKCKIRVC